MCQKLNFNMTVSKMDLPLRKWNPTFLSQVNETVFVSSLCRRHLPADVIHTVGPIAQGRVGDVEKEALRSCYRNSLNAATQHAARSVVRTEGLHDGLSKHKLEGDAREVAHR